MKINPLKASFFLETQKAMMHSEYLFTPFSYLRKAAIEWLNNIFTEKDMDYSYYVIYMRTNEISQMIIYRLLNPKIETQNITIILDMKGSADIIWLFLIITTKHVFMHAIIIYWHTLVCICMHSKPEEKNWPLFSFPFLLLVVPSFLFSKMYHKQEL